MIKKLSIALLILVGAFAVYQVNSNDEITAEKMTVAFTGMELSCDGCKTGVQTALSKVLGIKDSKIVPAEGLVKVTFSTKVMKAGWIENSLEAAGFNPDDFTVKPAS